MCAILSVAWRRVSEYNQKHYFLPRSIANIVYVIHSNMTLKEYFNAEYLCVWIGYEHVESFVVCIVGNLNGTRCRDGMKCCGVIPI